MQMAEMPFKCVSFVCSEGKKKSSVQIQKEAAIHTRDSHSLLRV